MNKVLHRCLRTVPVPKRRKYFPSKKKPKTKPNPPPKKKNLKKPKKTPKGSQTMFPQTYEINELRITQTTVGKGGHHCPEDFTS